MSQFAHARRYPNGGWVWVNLDYVQTMERMAASSAPKAARITKITLHDGMHFAVLELPRQLLTDDSRLGPREALDE